MRFQTITDMCGQVLNLINARVLKIERGLYVKMLYSVPLRFDRERMQLA